MSHCHSSVEWQYVRCVGFIRRVAVIDQLKVSLIVGDDKASEAELLS